MNNSDAPIKSTSLVCHICKERFRRPHLLPCLHVFCLVCLQDECQGKSPDRFQCPLCVVATADGGGKEGKTVHARPWHGFERIAEKEAETEIEDDRSLAEQRSAFEDGGDVEEGEESEEDSSAGSEGSNSNLETRNNGDGGGGGKKNFSNVPPEPPLLFPCTIHPDRLADTFCFKCQQLACHKCVSSFHRRCQQFSDVKSAVETKRAEFDEIHSKMASNLVACNEVESYNSDRIKELEEMRTRVLIEIKTFRTELVNMILAKEKALTTQANYLIDQMKTEAATKMNAASKMSESLDKQMEFLDLSISVKGEGELLPLFPGIASGIEKDAELIGAQYSDVIKEVTFSRDESCNETIKNSLLGEVIMEKTESDESTNPNTSGFRQNLNLTLVTSFHGGTRDDVTEPLLTDLILLANGDVILTDRDNKCVKKFNQSGKLLTRVIIEAIPSRIATVSHGRAVVSVMTKKCLYFLSLFGTVRILNSVPVKKIYSFLTSIGNGLLIAGTNQCDSIDLISERGETLRKILTQKPDRAVIARPLYLTPVVPHSTISLRLSNTSGTNHNKNTSNNDNNNNNNKSNIKDSHNNTSHNGGRRNSNSNQTNAGNHSSEDNISASNKKHKDNTKYNNTTPSSSSLSSSMPMKKTLNSSKVLPQIVVKNGKNGGGGEKSSSSNSITSSASAVTNSASENSRRRTSLPATQHISPPAAQTQNQNSSLSSSSLGLSSSSATSLSVSNKNLLSSSSSSLLSPPSSSSQQTGIPSSEIALLVSDSGKRVLFRMEQDGSTAFTFKSSDHVTLECPLGVTVHESGLTLLSDRDSDSVLLLDESGAFIKKVLTSSDGLSKPCGLYAGNKGMVGLSQVDGMVKIYRPTKS